MDTDWVVILSYRAEWSSDYGPFNAHGPQYVEENLELHREYGEKNIVEYICQRLAVSPHGRHIHIIFKSFEDVLAYSSCYGDVEPQLAEHSIIKPPIDPNLYDQGSEFCDGGYLKAVEKYNKEIDNLKEKVRARFPQVVKENENKKKAEQEKREAEEKHRKAESELAYRKAQYEQLKKEFEPA